MPGGVTVKRTQLVGTKMEDETRNTEVEGETSTSGERPKYRGKTENMTAKEQIEKKRPKNSLTVNSWRIEENTLSLPLSANTKKTNESR